jgi:hypothetical protein
VKRGLKLPDDPSFVFSAVMAGTSLLATLALTVAALI